MTEFNINTIIALMAMLIAGATIFFRIIDKSLSLREHEEFKGSVQEELKIIKQRQELRLETSSFIRWSDEWKAQVNRDFDRVEEDIRLIDAAKPSAGELQEAMKAVDARVTHIEEMIKLLRENNNH